MKKEDNCEELNIHDLMKLKCDPKEKAKCERAFRRGFHHGWVLGKDKKSKITEEDIMDWRYSYPIQRDFSPAHLTREMIRKGIKENHVDVDED